MSRRWVVGLLASVVLAVALTGCTLQLPGDLPGKLPREWREALYGPDPTATPRLRDVPTPTPLPEIGTPVPAPIPTPLPTLTPGPTRTSTVTRTATATPAYETLTIQQGATWYVKGRFAPYEGMEDTYISDWNRNTNFADAPILSVRQGNVMAALLYIHLGDLPPALPVSRAELSIYVSARSNDTPMTIALRPAIKPWLLKEATWLRANDSLLWQTPGAQGEADRSPEPAAEVLASERTGWLTFDVTSLVRTWLRDPKANQGLVISGEAANAVQYDLASAEARDPQRRPRLTLTLPTGALALGPRVAATPTNTLTPTPNPLRPETVDVLRLLPLGSSLAARGVGDLDGSGALDIVAAYRAAGSSGLRLAVFTHPGGAGDYRLYWSSPEVGGVAPASLDLADITGDGVPEIMLSVASPWSGGRMLFVFVRRPLDYRLAAPLGGYFDGKDYYGESGFDLADVNGDGRAEIRARHDNQTDVYAWDGVNFVAVK